MEVDQQLGVDERLVVYDTADIDEIKPVALGRTVPAYLIGELVPAFFLHARVVGGTFAQNHCEVGWVLFRRELENGRVLRCPQVDVHGRELVVELFTPGLLGWSAGGHRQNRSQHSKNLALAVHAAPYTLVDEA